MAGRADDWQKPLGDMRKASDELGSAAKKLDLAFESLKGRERKAPEVDLFREEVVDVQARVERLRLALCSQGRPNPAPQDEPDPAPQDEQKLGDD